MLAKLKSWADRLSATDAGPAPAEGIGELEAATATLLVEAASLDGEFDASEEAIIRRLLTEEFGLDDGEADGLINDARTRADTSVGFYGVTRQIKDRMTPEDRVAVLEMVWAVAYADGNLHDFEANLARRIAGLLHVPDRDSGAARKRALARLERGADRA
jgi:uncharacterized tellurite resistance protein B-like protein